MAEPVPVIALFGPTAVGKTDLLVSLFPGEGEIISADCMQVYRHMDVGTAKPDMSTRKILPHHLIDVLDPGDQYSVGMFLENADALVREISRRGLIPVISGGTAYYFKHFLFGLPGTPKADHRVRREIQEELSLHGAESLYRNLEALDPAAAENIEKRDTYRITRALEVIRQTGKPFSSFKLPEVPRKEVSLLLLGLQREREELYRRIEARVDAMFELGLVNEIKTLISMGCTRNDPGMQGIGYKEFMEMMHGGCVPVKEVKELIKKHSKQYAKRQITFFSRLPGVRWFHPDDEEKIGACIHSFTSGES